MDRLRQWLRNWLGFSRTESNGFVILLPLMVILLLSEPVYEAYRRSRPINFSSDNSARLDSIIAQWKDVSVKAEYSVVHDATVENFHTFDPNKITEIEMNDMGFPKHLSRRIASYRQKGGIFRVKPDLMKIYGVDSTFYHQLYAYIALPEKSERRFPQVKFPEKKALRSETKLFDLNTADTIKLKEINGIGKTLAARIVKFRDGLGGFVSVDQVSEVFGLDSIVAKELKKRSFIAQDFTPARININTSDENKLALHPYIRKKLAKAIVTYRYQHGKFNNPDEINRIFIATPHEAEKLLPYVTVQD